MANGLWQKLENRHASNVANRENRDNNSSLLYQALMTGNNKGNNNSFASNTEQASQGFDGLANFAKAFKTNSAITDAINANVGGSTASNSGGFFSKLKGGSGGGAPWALIGSLAKGGYNSISGKDDKDYSDLEEGIIYPLQGAAMGSSFGPWGALGGALYGLSYGFKDDTNKWVGIKDGSFWDKLRHPIGMGDGGGFIDLG